MSAEIAGSGAGPSLSPRARHRRREHPPFPSWLRAGSLGLADPAIAEAEHFARGPRAHRPVGPQRHAAGITTVSRDACCSRSAIRKAGRSPSAGGSLPGGPAATNPAKYINSPESPLFSKSNMLYGLDLAREAITKSRVAIVMEGYTDCIVARQFGIENVVAVLGTALGDRRGPTGEGHIQLLRRFAETIILVLDGDEAGRKRTHEILSLFVAEQVDLRVVTLPDELDPCDFLLAHGADAFRSQLETAVDGLEHAFRMATQGLDIQRQPHEASKTLDGLLQTIAKAPRLRNDTTSDLRVRESQNVSRLARMFDAEETVLWERVRAAPKASARLPQPTSPMPIRRRPFRRSTLGIKSCWRSCSWSRNPSGRSLRSFARSIWRLRPADESTPSAVPSRLRA